MSRPMRGPRRDRLGRPIRAGAARTKRQKAHDRALRVALPARLVSALRARVAAAEIKRDEDGSTWLSPAYAARYSRLDPRTIRTWRKACPWLPDGRGLESRTFVDDGIGQYIQYISKMDLDAARKNSNAGKVPDEDGSPPTVSQANAARRLQVAPATLRHWCHWPCWLIGRKLRFVKARHKGGRFARTVNRPLAIDVDAAEQQRLRLAEGMTYLEAANYFGVQPATVRFWHLRGRKGIGKLKGHVGPSGRKWPRTVLRILLADAEAYKDAIEERVRRVEAAPSSKPPPNGHATPAKPPAKRRGGRPKASDEQFDARLERIWREAQSQGASKKDFIRAKGISLRDFDKLLARQRMRRSAK